MSRISPRWRSLIRLREPGEDGVQPHCPLATAAGEVPHYRRALRFYPGRFRGRLFSYLLLADCSRTSHRRVCIDLAALSALLSYSFIFHYAAWEQRLYERRGSVEWKCAGNCGTRKAIEEIYPPKSNMQSNLIEEKRFTMIYRALRGQSKSN